MGTDAALHNGNSGEGHRLLGPAVEGLSEKRRTNLHIQGDAVLAPKLGKPYQSVEKAS